MSSDLRRRLAAPAKRRPIVIFGAGSILGCKHLPAWAEGSYEVAGTFDPDAAKAAEPAAAHGTRASSEAQAQAVDGAVFDFSTLSGSGAAKAAPSQRALPMPPSPTPHRHVCRPAAPRPASAPCAGSECGRGAAGARSWRWLRSLRTTA